MSELELEFNRRRMDLNLKLYNELMSGLNHELMRKFVREGADLDYVFNVIKAEQERVIKAIERLKQ